MTPATIQIVTFALAAAVAGAMFGFVIVSVFRTELGASRSSARYHGRREAAVVFFRVYSDRMIHAAREGLKRCALCDQMHDDLAAAAFRVLFAGDEDLEKPNKKETHERELERRALDAIVELAKRAATAKGDASTYERELVRLVHERRDRLAPECVTLEVK